MNKYGNKKTVVDGIKFDSKKEAARWGILQLRERAGEIEHLELQPTYPIEVNGVHICKYIADFRYREKRKLVVEDCKGMKTRIYSIKRKLMKAVYGIEIKET